jgi:hypothetical protein
VGDATATATATTATAPTAITIATTSATGTSSTPAAAPALAIADYRTIPNGPQSQCSQYRTWVSFPQEQDMEASSIPAIGMYYTDIMQYTLMIDI